MAIENPSAIASGTSFTSAGNEITPVFRSTLIFFLFPRRVMENWFPHFSTRFHSCFSVREKNLTDRLPGWPFVPGFPFIPGTPLIAGVSLVPGVPLVPLTPGTPGTPLTTPCHLPMQIPQLASSDQYCSFSFLHVQSAAFVWLFDLTTLGKNVFPD